MTTWVSYAIWAGFFIALVGVLYLAEVWGLRLIARLRERSRKKREGDP